MQAAEVATPTHARNWQTVVEERLANIQEQFPMPATGSKHDADNYSMVYEVDSPTHETVFHLVHGTSPKLDVRPPHDGIDESLWHLGFEDDFPQEFRPTLLPVIEAFDAVGVRAVFLADAHQDGRLSLSLFVDCDGDITEICTNVTPDIEYELPTLVNQWIAYADEMVR